jgi:hypothetical protein
MYAYEKTIACLANSRKISGRCIAGKEYINGEFGAWIRPVSNRSDEEISEEDRRYEDGTYAKLLHVVTIPMKKHVRDGFQTENHLIDESYYWSKAADIGWQDLDAAVDPCEELWLNGESSYSGINDRISAESVAEIASSLLFIGPLRISLHVSAEGMAFGNTKRSVRAFFRFKSAQYGIKVTDPFIEREYLGRKDGHYQIETAYLCVSLAKVWNNFAYKLAASIITPDRAV